MSKILWSRLLPDFFLSNVAIKTDSQSLTTNCQATKEKWIVLGVILSYIILDSVGTYFKSGYTQTFLDT